MVTIRKYARTFRAAFKAARTAYEISGDTHSQHPTIQSLCTASLHPARSGISRGIGRSISSFFKPRSTANSIQWPRRKSISDTTTAVLLESEAERARSLERQAQFSKSIITREAQQLLYDIASGEYKARSLISSVKSQQASPCFSVSRRHTNLYPAHLTSCSPRVPKKG